jgi:hypothetical protein
MARSSKSKEIESGILSSRTAGELLAISPETVKRLCRDGTISAVNISRSAERKEWRIPAPNLLSYCNSNEYPVHKELARAVICYRRNFFQNTEILRKKLSPKGARQ